VHQLAAQGRKLLVPGREELLPIGPAREVRQQPRPLLKRQPIPATRLGVGGNEARRCPIQLCPSNLPASHHHRHLRPPPPPAAPTAPAPPPPPARAAPPPPPRGPGPPAAAPPASVARPPASHPRHSASLAVRNDRPVSRTWSASRSDVLPWPFLPTRTF